VLRKQSYVCSSFHVRNPSHIQTSVGRNELRHCVQFAVHRGQDSTALYSASQNPCSVQIRDHVGSGLITAKRVASNIKRYAKPAAAATGSLRFSAACTRESRCIHIRYASLLVCNVLVALQCFNTRRAFLIGHYSFDCLRAAVQCSRVDTIPACRSIRSAPLRPKNYEDVKIAFDRISIVADRRRPTGVSRLDSMELEVGSDSARRACMRLLVRRVTWFDACTGHEPHLGLR
jgi:hypothetical protein